MSNAFDFFDEIYCVHLPEDIDRQNQMKMIFGQLGILNRVINISAPRPYYGYKSTNYSFAGEFGVVRSQLKILVDALHRNPTRGVAIFEDDVCFLDNTNEILKTCLNQLPKDWDILYLGGTPKEMMTRVDTHICKVNKFISAMAYCINAKTLKEYIDFYIDRMGEPFPDACCDNILNDFIILKNKNGYACTPPIAWDIPGWSTLRQGHRNYRNGIKTAWETYTPSQL